GGGTVDLGGLVAVPAGVVTPIGPVVAPVGRVVGIEVDEFTVKLAATPLMVTDVTPVKFVPVIVTLVPTGPLVGEKLVIVGGGMTVKLLAPVAVPAEVVTFVGPVVAPAGTVAVIDVDEFNVKLALVPLKRTAVAPEKGGGRAGEGRAGNRHAGADRAARRREAADRRRVGNRDVDRIRIPADSKNILRNGRQAVRGVADRSRVPGDRIRRGRARADERP